MARGRAQAVKLLLNLIDYWWTNVAHKPADIPAPIDWTDGTP